MDNQKEKLYNIVKMFYTEVFLPFIILPEIKIIIIRR